MRAVVLALALVTLAVPAAAQDARSVAPGEAAAPEADPATPRTAEGTSAEGATLVVVVDVGRARINTDRLLRAVAGTLGRTVVRITDPRAAGATGTLTFAHESRGRWLVRFDATDGSASTLAEITRPGIYDVLLAQAARRVVSRIQDAPSSDSSSSDSASSDALRRPAPSRAETRDDFERFYVRWAEEILDPFAGGAAPPPRAFALVSEVLDPFAPGTVRRVSYSEVLDPWGP